MATTLTLSDAQGPRWNALVVGAGPAGTVAARELARHGQRVLLVDKRSFPRDKVCGSCLSRWALDLLASIGLGELPSQLGGRRYDEFRLCSRGAAATLPLPGGIAVTRSALDNALAQAAVDEGACFLPSTQAYLDPVSGDGRRVLLRQADAELAVTAQVVVAADGVGGKLLASEPGIKYQTWRNSRIGAGTVLADDSQAYQPGAIYMAVARHGYVGFVRAEDRYLTIAAALDTGLVRRHGSVAAAIGLIMQENRMPRLSGFQGTSWRGTGPLTRQVSRAAGERLFIIGDAAGYVEPFTGEGLAWAMSSAVMVTPHALAAIEDWQPEIAANWVAAYRKGLRGRQQSCFRLARLLRHPWLVRNTVSALSRFPSLAEPLVRRMNPQRAGL